MNLLPFSFEVHIPRFDEKAYALSLAEDFDCGRGRRLSPGERSLALAGEKARLAYLELQSRFGSDEDILVLSADTVVVLDGEILEKGETREKSLAMLKKLNGKAHEVITAVCLKGRKANTPIYEHFAVSAKVYFGDTDLATLEWYLDHHQPYDKAGAYGIQDAGVLLVDRIEGGFHCVMGLPAREVYLVLRKYIGF